jgi:hypothetical protein
MGVRIGIQLTSMCRRHSQQREFICGERAHADIFHHSLVIQLGGLMQRC